MLAEILRERGKNPDEAVMVGDTEFDLEMAKSEDPNIVAAASSGAALAVDMVLQIGGQLIAIVALVAMVDGFLSGIGKLIDVTLSFNIICSYIFYATISPD